MIGCRWRYMARSWDTGVSRHAHADAISAWQQWPPLGPDAIISYPMLKPHDLRHGVAMEILEQHQDLEAVRVMLGHTRIDTTQTYARIRPASLKRAGEFYERKAVDLLAQLSWQRDSV